jgi:hypothetical protein
MELYANIKNPFNPEKFSSEEEIVSVGVPEGTFQFDADTKNFRVFSSFAGSFTSALKDAGFDGVMYQQGQEVVAFNPNQIKSATGNKGTFNPDSNKITESLTGRQKAMLERWKDYP